MNSFQIRAYQPEDCEEMLQLLCDTVLEVTKPDYTAEQRGAWIRCADDCAVMASVFFQHHTFVALSDNKIVGFGDVDAGGCLDHLYVHKDFQRQGIASSLLNVLEACAVLHGVPRMVSYVSITAESFFAKHGYIVLERQLVERHGLALPNCRMEKELVAPE